RYVSQTFRSVCGVTAKDAWPDPNILRVNEVTNEIYLTPFFDFGVTDPRNIQIFTAVAIQVENDFQDEACLPEGLANCGATWGVDVYKKMAKESFPNYRRQWNTAHDPAAAAKKQVNDQNNRVRGRRFTKAQQHQTVVDQYVVNKQLDPKVIRDLMNEEHMSDEASGPEDETRESFANWKVRMARRSNKGDLTPDQLAESHFVEVLEAEWRSPEFSALNFDIHETWWDSLTPHQKGNLKFIRVRGTGRRSSRIPKLAPYNFGINQEWLERHRFDPRYQEMLSDWNTHGNPPGF
ncbi:hypothetical protein FB451DRAFT_950517, partial [Mycena latifolia]